MELRFIQRFFLFPFSKEKRKIAIRDAKTDWLNQNQNKQDFGRLSLQTDNLSSDNYHQLREATSDLLIKSHHNMDVNGNNSNAGKNLILTILSFRILL